MDAIVNFKQAAAAFQSDERYLALVAARKANDEDEGLQAMIGDFNLIRLELNNEMSKENSDEEKVNTLNARINKLYSGIMENPNMQAYNKAKDEIEKFMEYVNAVLNAAIDGQDPLDVEEPHAHNCGSGGCSSCSGCC